ncbi:MAG: alanine--tRNA ligase [Rickettsiales bacterium]
MKALNDIRTEFIDFFKKHQHDHVASSPLVPLSDPTLMFTNAGMVQFKDIFTGRKDSPYRRAVTSQKCVRAGGKHNDLDNVGYTGRHLTFFEMLGNFSFGDYFKQEAIKFSWDFLTKNLGLNKEKLYFTVYHNDEEAFEIWKKVTGYGDDRIIRIKTDDNFWSMGDLGPCGPCSEIFYDHGDQVFGGLPGTKDEDGDRYVEIWNLVFMQFEKMLDGTQHALPKCSIDTGMGLERITAVCQGVLDNYHTDLFKDLIGASQEFSSTDSIGKKKFSHRIISDHLRSSAFLIADGVMPSNEGRGYVLRRIIRRAVRHIHELECKDLLLPKILPTLVNNMSEAYPQLIKAEGLIKDVLSNEESLFRGTIDKGIALFDQEISKMKGKKFSGDVAFKLHDTYGFPIDLTCTLLKEKGLDVDMPAFNKAMDNQKLAARKSWKGSGEKQEEDIWFDINRKVGDTEFVGYEHLSGKGIVKALVQNDRVTPYVDNKEEFYLIVNQTPFYGESGGQMGDVGKVALDGTQIDVIDTQKKAGGLHVHKCRLLKGLIKNLDEVSLDVNSEHRNSLRANHTATHLLHASLRKKLGEHVVQKGSLVAADKLRFDFSSTKPVPKNTLQEVENEINSLIIRNSKVKSFIKPYDDAVNSGAMALFGEKYDDKVRVIYIGEDEDYHSIELCGGTHVSSLSEICSFNIISESAIAAGIRRIEAVTRNESYNLNKNNKDSLGDVGEFLRCTRSEIVGKVKSLVEEKKLLKKELSKFRIDQAAKRVFNENNYYQYNGFNCLVEVLEGLDAKDLKELCSYSNKKPEKLILCLVSVDKEANNASFIINVSKEVTKTVGAKDILAILSTVYSLRGGGNQDFAQGGGELHSSIDKRLIVDHIKSLIEG